MLAISPFGYLFDYVMFLLVVLLVLSHTWMFFRFVPRERRGRKALVVGNLLVLASILAILALAAESHLRFVSVNTEGFGLSMPARRWFTLHVELNSLGCRDDEWQRGSKDVHRIAVIGDSYAYGWGIENPADRFSDLLQERLTASGGNAVEVMNVAKPGWGSESQLGPIRDMIEHYDVREIILAYLPNDIESAIPVDPAFDPTRPPESNWFNPDGSCLMDYLYRRLVLPRLPSVRGYHEWLTAGFADSQVWRKHQQSLGAIIDVCRREQVRLRVVLLPFLLPEESVFDSEGIHTILANFFKANGVEVLDLLPVLSAESYGSLIVNTADAHPNERAHALFAGAIYQAFYESPTGEAN